MGSTLAEEMTPLVRPAVSTLLGQGKKGGCSPDEDWPRQPSWWKPRRGPAEGLSILEEAKKTAASDTERTKSTPPSPAGHESLDDDNAKAFKVSAESGEAVPRIRPRRLWAKERVEQALGRYADAKAGAEERLKRHSR